jgi:hypothetical protein
VETKDRRAFSTTVNLYWQSGLTVGEMVERRSVGIDNGASKTNPESKKKNQG